MVLLYLLVYQNTVALLFLIETSSFLFIYLEGRPGSAQARSKAATSRPGTATAANGRPGSARRQPPRRPATGSAKTRTRAASATRRPQSRSGFAMSATRRPPPKKRPASVNANKQKTRPRQQAPQTAQRPTTPQIILNPPEPSTSEQPASGNSSIMLDESFDDRPQSRQKLLRADSRAHLYKLNKQKPKPKIIKSRVPAYMLPGICLSMLGFLFIVAGIMMISITSTSQDKPSAGVKAVGPILLIIGLASTVGGFTYKFIKHRQHKKQELEKLNAAKKNLETMEHAVDEEGRCTSPEFTDEVVLGIDNELAKKHKVCLPGRGFTNQGYDPTSTTPSPRLPLKNMFLASSFSELPRDNESLSSESSISLPSGFGDSVLASDLNNPADANQTHDFGERNLETLGEFQVNEMPTHKESTQSEGIIPHGIPVYSNGNVPNHVGHDSSDDAGIKKTSKNKGNKSQIKNFRRKNGHKSIDMNGNGLHAIEEQHKDSNGVLKTSSSSNSVHNLENSHVTLIEGDNQVTLTDQADNKLTLTNQGNNHMTFNVKHTLEDSGDHDDAEITTVDAHIIIERRMSYQI